MIFTYYDKRLDTVPFLCVDGVVEGGLNLSHWPGNRTPAHLKADTSTEMALKLARDSGRASWLEGVSIVTNNHFDTDGLLSVFAALRPEEALRHEKAMIQAARTGDFGEWTTPEALKFDAVVTAYDDEERSCSGLDRKSTRLNSSHGYISYAVFCLKKKKNQHMQNRQ